MIKIRISKMRSYQFNWVKPLSKDWCPYKRQRREEDDTEEALP